jgi:lipoprotein-releasing system permease protein
MTFFRFEFNLALRHLTRGGVQTVLTIAAVATGVTVILFISSITFGIRNWAEELISDMMPDITVLVKDPVVNPAAFPGRTVLARAEPVAPRNLDIKDWREASRLIRALPRVVAVAPAILGSGTAWRGNKQYSLSIYGADPVELDRVTAIRKYIVAGRYAGLGANECVVDYKLVSELGIRIGDHLRLASSEGTSNDFLVVGLYDTGQERGLYKAFVTLRAAQSLFGTGEAVRSILVKTQSIWDAKLVADRISALTSYDAQYWGHDYPQSEAAIGIYDAVAYLVSIFSLIASSFAIASVLIVQVLQKGRQIGILKALGARNQQVFRTFLIEAMIVSVLGSSIGAALGWGLVAVLSQFKLPASSSGQISTNLFPTYLTPEFTLIAMAAAVVATVIAAVLPARRAARIDPAQVMR